MFSFFRMLHVIGIVMWFGTMVLDIYVLPAARRKDTEHTAWAYRLYAKALTFELIGLAALATGGIGMLVVYGWWPWEFTWLLVKLSAVAFLILGRALVYVYIFRNFRLEPSGTEGSLEQRLAVTIAGYERLGKILAVPTLIALVLVLWMAFWRPF